MQEIDQEKLEQMVAQLKIKLENIHHVILNNGIEMMGELQQDLIDVELIDEDDELTFTIEPEESDTYLFLNPIKIFRDSWIDNDGNHNYNNYYLEWNPCIDGPYTPISKYSITSINIPNELAMIGYLDAVYKEYYPALIGEEVKMIMEKIVIVESKNIIDFSTYLMNRSKGIF